MNEICGKKGGKKRPDRHKGEICRIVLGQKFLFYASSFTLSYFLKFVFFSLYSASYRNIQNF